jgi:hypothetical protein
LTKKLKRNAVRFSNQRIENKREDPFFQIIAMDNDENGTKILLSKFHTVEIQNEDEIGYFLYLICVHKE